MFTVNKGRLVTWFTEHKEVSKQKLTRAGAEHSIFSKTSYGSIGLLGHPGLFVCLFEKSAHYGDSLVCK